LFGYPDSHEDDAERAVRAGLELCASVRALRLGEATMRCRAGIATGVVIVRDVAGAGQDRRHEVIGDTPDLAARLRISAPSDTVTIGPVTRRLVGNLFDCRDLSALEIGSGAEPIQRWQVTAERSVESRFEALRGTALSPLIGRDEQIELLLRRWKQAKAGNGQVVLVSGEPGIGKSRLAAALAERLGKTPSATNPLRFPGERGCQEILRTNNSVAPAKAGAQSLPLVRTRGQVTENPGFPLARERRGERASEPGSVLRYFCSPYHQDSALYPIITQLERAAGFARNDGATEKLRKLKAMLATAAPQGTEFALLSELLSLSDHEATAVLRDMAPRRKREKTLEALLLQLEILASQQPVLIVFEDIHWIDPSSLELLGMIVERVQQLPVLLLVTARPEFTPPWPNHAYVTTLPLTRLSRRDGATLAQHVTGGKALPREVMDQILVRTDGVPLFVEELTKMLMESSLMQERAGGYVLNGPLPTLAIPATLHDSLMARLDRLSPVRDVAQIGAAIGREFSYELLSAVAELSGPECDEALGRLVQSELVFRRGTPPQAMYMFKHALVRDAVYGTLLRGRRQHLHARIATSLEQHFPEITTSQPELLAQHCVEAGLSEKAAIYYLAAGRLALARSATVEAVAHLKKGIDLLARLPCGLGHQHERLEFDLQVALGGALMAAKGYAHPDVIHAYERARSLAAGIGSGSSMLTFPVLWGLCTASYVAGKAHAALRQAEELLSIAQAQTETGPLVIGHGLVGCTLIMNADFPGALAQLQRAVALYDPAEHRALTFQYAQDIGVRALCYLSIALWHCGYPDQATSAARKALCYARDAAHAHTLAFALFFGALTAIFQRCATEVEERANASIALSNEHGFAHWLARCQVLQGWAMAQAGHGRVAVERIREGLSATAATGSGLWEPFLLGLLAEALSVAGEIDEGLAVVAQGLAAANVSGQFGANAELHRLRGELLRRLHNPDPRELESCFRKGIAVARKQGSRGFELRAAVNLARLLSDQGQRDEARNALAPVYAQFNEGFDLPDLKDAKAILVALS
jgi:predicted ATPase